MRIEKGRVWRDEKGWLQMRVNNAIVWKDKAYDVGTRLKIQSCKYGIQNGTYVGDGWVKMDNGYRQRVSVYHSPYIIEILEPVEIIFEEELPKPSQPKETLADFITSKPHPNNTDTVFYGWWWYIAIMILGAIFKDRWIIWIAASIVFFSWKHSK